MADLIKLVAVSSLLSVLLFGTFLVYTTNGVTYAEFPDEEVLTDLGYEEANKLINSRATRMTFFESLKFNLAGPHFWWNLFYLCLISVATSVASYLFVKDRSAT